MTHAECAKSACECIAAIFALLAAGFWFAAACYPVGVPGLPVIMPQDRTHPLWGQIKAHGDKILRGAGLNRIAAALTGVSALAQALALMASHIWR
jgi:hypothetical protein